MGKQKARKRKSQHVRPFRAADLIIAAGLAVVTLTIYAQVIWLVLLASGKARESISEFETALRVKPGLKVAADNLRRAQTQLGLQPK